MMFLSGLIVGCVLGVYASLILWLLWLAHRVPDGTSIYDFALPPTRRDPPPMP